MPRTDILVLTRNQRLARRLHELARTFDATVIQVDSIAALHANAGLLILDLAHEQAKPRPVVDLQTTLGEPLPLIVGVPAPDGPSNEELAMFALDGLMSIPLNENDLRTWLRLAARIGRPPDSPTMINEAPGEEWLGALVDAETAVTRARVLVKMLISMSGRQAGVGWLPDDDGIDLRTAAVEGLSPGLVPGRVSTWSLTPLADERSNSLELEIGCFNPGESMLVDRLMDSVGATDADFVEINRDGRPIAVVALMGGEGKLDMSDGIRRLCRQAALLIDQGIQIERAEAHAARVVELERHLPMPLMLIDRRGNILQVNEAASQLTGYDIDDLLLMRLHDLVSQEAATNRLDDLLVESSGSGIGDRPLSLETEVIVRSTRGTPVTLYIWPSSRRDPESGRLANVLIAPITTAADSDARELPAHPATDLEQYDDLYADAVTGLPDRRAVLAWINGRFTAVPSEQLSVLMVGIDRFKKINDTYGYRVGDALLSQVGATLRNQLPPDAYLGRFASDEFVLAYPGIGRDEIYAVAEGVRIAVATHLYTADDQLEQLTVSIGAATFPEDAADVDQIMLATNHAMRLAKQAGRNQVYQSNAAFSELAAHHGRLTDLLRQAPRETLALLVKAMDQRLPERAGHAQRVARFAVAIAEEIGIPQARIDALRVAALVHDIGMFALPDSVLRKPIHLSDGERRMLNRIPEMAQRLLSQIDLPLPVVPAVVHQHEYWDGSGRPAGLAGDQIPIEARIIAVADALDALSSDRAHRAALRIDQALEILRHSAGTQFDPEVVEAACGCLGLDTIEFRDGADALDEALLLVAD